MICSQVGPPPAGINHSSGFKFSRAGDHGEWSRAPDALYRRLTARFYTSFLSRRPQRRIKFEARDARRRGYDINLHRTSAEEQPRRRNLHCPIKKVALCVAEEHAQQAERLGRDELATYFLTGKPAAL